MFLMIITAINKLTSLTKHVPCKCECKFGSKNYNSNWKWNNDKYLRERRDPKENSVIKKIYFEILLHVLVNMVNI